MRYTRLLILLFGLLLFSQNGMADYVPAFHQAWDCKNERTGNPFSPRQLVCHNWTDVQIDVAGNRARATGSADITGGIVWEGICEWNFHREEDKGYIYYHFGHCSVYGQPYDLDFQYSKGSARDSISKEVDALFPPPPPIFSETANKRCRKFGNSLKGKGLRVSFKVRAESVTKVNDVLEQSTEVIILPLDISDHCEGRFDHFITLGEKAALVLPHAQRVPIQIEQQFIQSEGEGESWQDMGLHIGSMHKKVVDEILTELKLTSFAWDKGASDFGLFIGNAYDADNDLTPSRFVGTADSNSGDAYRIFISRVSKLSIPYR